MKTLQYNLYFRRYKFSKDAKTADKETNVVYNSENVITGEFMIMYIFSFKLIFIFMNYIPKWVGNEAKIFIRIQNI